RGAGSGGRSRRCTHRHRSETWSRRRGTRTCLPPP
ncbi:hypothetical protein ACMD2_09984, partial [Ananas comosus]